MQPAPTLPSPPTDLPRSRVAAARPADGRAARARRRRLAVAAIAIPLGLYLAVFAAMFALQRKLVFNIDPVRTQPAAIGLETVRELEIATPDGQRLVAWHAPARAGQPTLLYFHGQGGTLKQRARRIERFVNEGWGIFIPTWRGYGGSTGTPTEANTIADGKLAYETLRARGVAAADIVLYGESLGSGVAVPVAVEKPAAGLILDGPFTSAVDVAAERYPFLPVRLAMRDTYDSKRLIGRVKLPLLILHGELDPIIPVRFGRELHAVANEPKTLALFPRGRHTDLYFHGALETVREFITRVRPPR